MDPIPKNELIHHEFAHIDQRRILSLVPDIQRGWKPHKKVSCFVERVIIEALAECRLSVRLFIFPRTTTGCSRDWPAVPAFKNTSSAVHRRGHGRRPRDWGPVTWTSSEHGIAFQVPVLASDAGFNRDLKWEQRPSEKLELFLVEYDLPPHREMVFRYIDDHALAVEDLLFEIQLRIIAEPRPLSRPIQRDWYRRFCPGGLPSLGKRA